MSALRSGQYLRHTLESRRPVGKHSYQVSSSDGLSRGVR